jgi:hypothetical protein
MDGDRFDALTKTLTTTARSRRQALAGLALGALALLSGEAAAKPRRHRRGHRGSGSGSTHAAAPPPTKPDGSPTAPTGRCPDGFSNCRGHCVIITSNPNNCGACATICPTVPHGAPICTNRTCGFTCDPGYAHCSGDPTTGCETNILTDRANCGTCGHQCAVGTQCRNGACVPCTLLGHACQLDGDCCSNNCCRVPNSNDMVCSAGPCTT